MISLLIPATIPKQAPCGRHFFCSHKRMQPGLHASLSISGSGLLHHPHFIIDDPVQHIAAESVSRLPLSNSGRATEGRKIVGIMHGAGQRFEIRPARSEVVTSDKESAEAAFAIEHSESPESNVQRAVIQPIAGRSRAAFSGFSMTLKAITHEQIARRRFNIPSPAPQLLAHQLFGKLADGFRMTPATTNRARHSIGRDFAVRGPRGAGRFQNVRGNRDSPDVWDDEV